MARRDRAKNMQLKGGNTLLEQNQLKPTPDWSKQQRVCQQWLAEIPFTAFW